MKRVGLAGAWAILILCVGPGCASMGSFSPLWPLEKSLVFQATKYPEGRWEPASLGLEDAWFESTDGVKLHGWYAHQENPRAVIVFCHGNAGNLSSRGRTIADLRDKHNVAVLVFDYRGYGRSEGSPNEQGVLRDARAARKWVAERNGVPESEVILMGRSLGGGVAVELAAKDGCRALVLASTFTSLPDVAVHHVPWLPAHTLMTHRLNSLETIRGYYGPVFQVHGDDDETVPYPLGQQLHAAAPGPKRFVTVPGGHHNDPWGEDVHLAFEQFLEALEEAEKVGHPLVEWDGVWFADGIVPTGYANAKVQREVPPWAPMRDRYTPPESPDMPLLFALERLTVGRFYSHEPSHWPKGARLY